MRSSYCAMVSWKVTPSLCTLLLLFAVDALFAAENPSVDFDELFSRYKYASRSEVGGMLMKMTTVKTVDRPEIDRKRLEDELSSLRKELMREFEAGQINLGKGVAEAAKKRFGTDDVSKLMDMPDFKGFYEGVVESQLNEHQLAREILSSDATEERSVTVVIDADRNLRIEGNYVSYRRNGKEVEGHSGQADVTVLNAQYKKEYFPNRKAGFVYKGLAEEPTEFWETLGKPSVVDAGCPPAGGRVCKRENMKSVTEVDTPEGKAYKILFVDEITAATGNVYECWVLPEKGYRLQKCVRYANGLIMGADTYGDFREVEPNTWYPMRQTSQSYKNVRLPEDIKQKLQAGELTMSSPEVLSSQLCDNTETVECEVSYVELGAMADDAQFTLEFPIGTRVYDFVSSGKKGDPITYIKGDQGDKSVGDSVDVTVPPVDELLVPVVIGEEQPDKPASSVSSRQPVTQKAQAPREKKRVVILPVTVGVLLAGAAFLVLWKRRL